MITSQENQELLVMPNYPLKLSPTEKMQIGDPEEAMGLRGSSSGDLRN
jgi:hypothetical protein